MLGDRIARAVGARPHSIAPGAKPLYHASATLAAGGAAAVLAVAVRGWVDAGIPEDVAREALSALAVRAADAVGHRTFAEAFTGAVARRDVGTVEAHAEALAGRSDVLVLYRTLGERDSRAHARARKGIGDPADSRATPPRGVKGASGVPVTLSGCYNFG